MKYLKEEEPITTSDGKSIKVFHLIFKMSLKFLKRQKNSEGIIALIMSWKKMVVAIKISPSQYLKDYKLPSDDIVLGVQQCQEILEKY